MKIRKLMTIILIVLCFSQSVSANMIWEEVNTETVTKGVLHTQTVRFRDEGWERTHVLEIDLTNENLDLTVLFPEKGISKLETLPQMAKKSGAVAAVNGDFFNFKGTPLGFTVEDGTVISSPAHDTGLAALMEDENGFVFTEYVKMNLVVTSPQGYQVPIIHINKYHPMESMVLYTKDWGAKTPGSHDGISELVVENGAVLEIRRDMDGVSVPENGYVLATSTLVNTFLVDNFVPGDKVELSYTLEPDFGKIQTAIGGGTVLVQNGLRAPFTNNVSGSHPRTAAGVDKSGKKLFLVTIDGRQTATNGMTQTELADYMIALGAYAAINLDGGGSTTMVVREGETNTLKTVNTPSDGATRSISTGIGVRFVGQVGALHTIEVNTQDRVIVEGEKAHLYLGAYDENHNPLYIADRHITYSSKDGTFENNVFYPSHTGKCTVTATCDGISGSLEIQVLKAPTPFMDAPSSEAKPFLLLPAAPDKKTLLNTLIKHRLSTLAAAETGNVINMGKNGYAEEKYQDSLFISINTNKGGIRRTDANQWHNILALRNQTDIKNIFICLSNSINTFSDAAERDLFYRILTEELRQSGKDVYLIEPGSKTEIQQKDGIHLITVAAHANIGTQDFYGDCERMCALRLFVSSEGISYENVPLWSTKKLQRDIA